MLGEILHVEPGEKPTANTVIRPKEELTREVPIPHLILSLSRYVHFKSIDGEDEIVVYEGVGFGRHHRDVMGADLLASDHEIEFTRTATVQAGDEYSLIMNAGQHSRYGIIIRGIAE
jgi:hypothetical protein